MFVDRQALEPFWNWPSYRNTKIPHRITHSPASAGRLFAPTAFASDCTNINSSSSVIAVLPFHREMTAKYSARKSSSLLDLRFVLVDNEPAGSATTTVTSHGPTPFVSWSATEIKFFHALLCPASTVRRLDGQPSTARL